MKFPIFEFSNLLFLNFDKTNFIQINNASKCTSKAPTLSSYRAILTLLRPDGVLIKYPQFPDVLNTLNVQPHNIFLLAF